MERKAKAVALAFGVALFLVYLAPVVLVSAPSPPPGCDVACPSSGSPSSALYGSLSYYYLHTGATWEQGTYAVTW